MINGKNLEENTDISVIIFEIAWEQFVIDILDVKEIVRAGQIRKLPNSPEFIQGIYNYRGEIIHIMDIKKKLKLNDYNIYRFNIGSKNLDKNNKAKNDINKKYIVISNYNDTFIGFIVDQIINVASVSNNQLIDLNPIFQTSISIDYIKSIIRFNDRPRILLNLSNLFDDVESILTQNKN